MDTKHIRISDYNYELPDERIAKFPLARRDHSKLLIYNNGKVSDDIFYSLPQHLPSGALMVYNNTRVIYARMHFRKETGALIEVFLMEPTLPANYEQMFQTTQQCSWLCMVGNLKKWKEGGVRTMEDIRKLDREHEDRSQAKNTAQTSLQKNGTRFSNFTQRSDDLDSLVMDQLNRKLKES